MIAVMASPVAGVPDEADSARTPKQLVTEAFDMLNKDGAAAAERAVQLLESKTKFQPQQIATLSWVAGTGYAIAGQHRPAIDYLEQAEQIYDQHEAKSMVVWVLRYKAAAHCEINEFEKGKQAATRGLTLAQETGASSLLRARLLNELGNNHLGAREYSKAADAWTQGLKIVGNRNRQLKDVLLTNVSHLLTQLSLEEEAVPILQTVLRHSLEYGHPEICVNAHHNLGLTWRLSRPADAEQEFRFAIAKSEGRFPLIDARSYMELGELLRNRGLFSDAKECFVKGRQLWEQAGNVQQIARAEELLERLEKPFTIEQLQIQLAIAEKANNLPRQQQVLSEIEELANRSGDKDALIETMKKRREVERLTLKNSRDNLVRTLGEMEHLKTAQELDTIRLKQQRQEQELRDKNARLTVLGIGIGVAILLAALCFRIARSRTEALSELSVAQAQIRQQEQVQAAIERRLIEKQKEESVTAMARGVAHDFNNLLTGISALAELGVFTEDESKKNENFREISGVVGQAAALTAQLSQYVGHRTGDTQNCCVTQVVTTGSGMLKALTRGETDLIVESTTERLPVLLSGSELSQILVNLVMNSVEACSAGGNIRVTTARRELTEPQLERLQTGSATSAGRFCCLSVADSGSGISNDMRKQIFDPYVSSKSVGRGLGLSTVLGIVRKARGAIEVESDSHGTAINVYLPEASEAEITAAVTRQNTETSAGICTALFVDDDDLVRSTSCAALQNQGLRILHAANAAEAEQILLTEGRQIECLVTDFSMPPGETGAWLAARAQKIVRGLPVILCTGFVDDIAPDDPRFVRVISKPFEASQLAAEIRREVARHHTSSGGLDVA